MLSAQRSRRASRLSSKCTTSQPGNNLCPPGFWSLCKASMLGARPTTCTHALVPGMYKLVTSVKTDFPDLASSSSLHFTRCGELVATAFGFCGNLESVQSRSRCQLLRRSKKTRATKSLVSLRDIQSHGCMMRPSHWYNLMLSHEK